MPDAGTALSIIGNALNAPAASAGSPAVVPDVPYPWETPQQATARTIAKASAATSPAGAISINDKLAILDQGKRGQFDYTAPPSAEFSAAHTVGNVGAGFNEGLAGTVGAPVDIATGIINNFSSPERVRRFVTGEGNAPLITNPVGGSQSLKQGYGAMTQAAGLPSGNPDQYRRTTTSNRLREPVVKASPRWCCPSVLRVLRVRRVPLRPRLSVAV